MKLAFAAVLCFLAASGAAEPAVFAASAPATMRMGYPQPSGAMLPIWVMTEEQIGSVLAVTDHPKAAAANPKDFFDNSFLKELEDTGFVRELYGRP
jgi:hypothetical protein